VEEEDVERSEAQTEGANTKIESKRESMTRMTAKGSFCMCRRSNVSK
jgi:hypothetical protein